MQSYTTNYTKPSATTTDWGLELRHTYGAEAEETTRIVYGDHVRIGGVAKVNYRFIATNYS